MSNEKKIQTVEVMDLYLSTFLLARNAELASSRTEYGKLVWTFRGPDIEALVMQFHSNGPVGVQDFIARMRSMRSMVRTVRP